MNNFRDGLQRSVSDGGIAQKDFKRAEVTLMRELAFEHIKTLFSVAMRIGVRVYEGELCLRVDQASNQPSGGDAINLNSPTGDPGASAKLRQRGVRPAGRC